VAVTTVALSIGGAAAAHAADPAAPPTACWWTCTPATGPAAQVWEPQSNGALCNPQSGRCLDDTGYGGSGTQLRIRDCTGNANQVWNLP
jgi:hypothetical protein